MSKWLQQTNGRWIMLSKRERLMVFCVGLFAIVGLMDTYLIDPVRQQKAQAEAELLKYREDTSKLQLEIATLKQGNASKSANPLQQQIDSLREQVANQEKLLSGLGDMMVSPDEILPVVKSLLAKHDNVTVLQLESVPPVSFIEKHLALAATAEPKQPYQMNLGVVYQHSLRVRVQGGYMAVMAYVADLKKLGGTIAWEKAELKSKYPMVELSMELYTLSNNSVWMGI